MSKKQEESFQFDKFMEDIVVREDQAKERSADYARKHADTPQRIYNRLYRERWQNRIKWGRK